MRGIYKKSEIHIFYSIVLFSKIWINHVIGARGTIRKDPHSSQRAHRSALN